MQRPRGREPSTMRAFAVVAAALVGLAVSLLPATERLDNALLDAQWSLLRKFATRPAPEDIVIVGIDEQSARSISAPMEMWHETLGMALVRIASARPRAVGIDLLLPERSYDGVKPGLDRALLVGLAAAREASPVVATLGIDARTRGARPIHAPLLAVLGQEGLGLGLLARDADGVTRRFALGVPTEDGSFPTLVGRLCRQLAQRCSDGLIDFALGPPFRYVPLRQVLDTRDTTVLGKLFRDRIVLVGEIRGYTQRIAVPANPAGWEENPHDSPAVVVQAQTLRSALQQSAPRESSRGVALLLVSLASLLVLARDLRYAAILALLAAGGVFILGCVALHGGLYVPLAGTMLTLLLVSLARAGWSVSRAFELRRRTS